MTHKHPRSGILATWPVILSLGLVTLLVIGMIGLDLYFSEKEASRTTDIIENAQRSIVLLNDIRSHAKGLVTADSDPEIHQLTGAIAAAAAKYDPLAIYGGERTEWTHLQELLRRLPVAPTETPSDRAQAVTAIENEIDRSVNTLVSINTSAGMGNLTAIRAAHRQAMWSDAVVGVGVVTIVTIISFWLLRVIARQRRLLTERVAFLNEKNLELEAFAGRAAHDLRSPMNPIRGYADLILEAAGLPDGVSAMARRIRQAVDRMARVVDDMLALSTSGHPPAGQASTSLVVARMIEEMGAELQGVEVVTKLHAGRVACTEGVLTQILRNLLGNALKFRSRSRPLRLTIETRDMGPMVELAIEDNGLGMDPEGAKHAFEPFYRGQMDRELPGHGLGLAIVERTTRALGGTCELSSVLDCSTRLVVRLPRPEGL